MTVVCAPCKKTMGEKCPKCGSPAVDAGSYVQDEFWCDSCITYFDRGEGGISHGICDECYPKINLQGSNPTGAMIKGEIE